MNHNTYIESKIEEIKSISETKRKLQRKKFRKTLYIALVVVFILALIGGGNDFTSAMVWIVFIILFILMKSIFKYGSYYEEVEDHIKFLNYLDRTNNSLPLYTEYSIKLNKDNVVICNDVKEEIFTIENNDFLDISEEDKSYTKVTGGSINRITNSVSTETKKIDDRNLYIAYQKDNEVNEMFFNNSDPVVYDLLFSRLPKKKVTVD